MPDMTKYFCFDTETGGLAESTSLLTLYGLILDDELNVIDKIDLKLKPADDIYLIESNALNINKINLGEHTKEASTYETGAGILKTFLSKHVTSIKQKLNIVGQNVIDFDIPRVKNFLLSSKEFDFYFSRDIYDTRVQGLFLRKLGIIPPEVNIGLQGQLKHFFPDLNLEGHHSAQWDAEHTRLLFKKHVSILE